MKPAVLVALLATVTRRFEREQDVRTPLVFHQMKIYYVKAQFTQLVQTSLLEFALFAEIHAVKLSA